MTELIATKEKQPKSLYLLFFTELWERFGFYTVQTIIVLYMTKMLLMSDNRAYSLYAAFSSLLYLTPTIGGYIADRFLGFQRAIILGGILLIIAYVITALPSEPAFFLGLSLLICGNGFFKPNVSSIVGELYRENDPRRDGGFTIFYMGINIGSLIPPLIAGAIVAHYGWHAGFLLAAVGMVIGQITFVLGRKMLKGAGAKPNDVHGPKQVGKRFYALLISGIILTVALCNLAFQYPEETNTVVIFSALIIIGVTLYFLIKEPLRERKRMFASLILILISIGFWSIYNQTFTSLMLYADRNMTRSIFGIPLDAEATQFFNPFFIILLSPILNLLWIKLDRFNMNPSIQMKFTLGILFMSFGFFILALAGRYFSSDGMTSAGWLAFSYLLQTVGELLISPIGLAMITVLCPKHLVGMMMGVWFFSQAAAFAIGGILAKYAAVPAGVDIVTSSAIYTHAFTFFGLITLVFAFFSLLLAPFLKRMID